MNLNNLTKSQLIEKVEGLEASIKEIEAQGMGGEDAQARKGENSGRAKASPGVLSGHQRVEGEPEENRNMLTVLFDLIPHQIFVKDLEGRYLMVNAAFTERTGLTEEMARGQTADALTILDEPSRRIYRDQDQEVLSTGERREYPVVRVRYQDGREVINRIIRMPLMGSGDKPVGLAGIVEDITERIQGDEALRRSEQIMDRAESVMHVGSMHWDLVNHRQYWSDEVFRILGHQPQSYIPGDQHFANALHPEDKKRVLVDIANAIQEHRAYNTECRVVRSDGTVRHISAQGEITWDDTGKPLLMFGTVQDITEKKQAELELRESEQRFRDLIEGSIQGILIHRRGKPLFVNQAYVLRLQRDANVVMVATPAIANVRYQFSYTISGATGDAALTITTAFAASAVSLSNSNGSDTVYFTSAAAPGSLILDGTSASGGITIDDVSLKQVIGGDLVSRGTIRPFVGPLEPYNCTEARWGDQYFDTTDGMMCICANDGTDEWQKISDGTADCSI